MSQRRTYLWSPEKCESLRKERGIGFEDVIVAIEKQRVLADIASPSRKFPHQRMLVVLIENYVHAVPYVEGKGLRFLKTIFPSRVLNKLYGVDENGAE
jgi:hypothetical protein